MEKFQEEIINRCMIDDSIKKMKYEGCIFKNCRVEFSTIINCEFIECTFIDCTINTLDFDNVSVRDCIFNKCNLINISWTEVSNKNLVAHPIDKMSQCLCKYNNFNQLSLAKMDLSTNEFIHCEYRDCNLLKTDFGSCNLTDTLFVNNNLSYTNFEYSYGFILDLRQNNLNKTRFSMEQASNLLHIFDVSIR